MKHIIIAAIVIMCAGCQQLEAAQPGFAQLDAAKQQAADTIAGASDRLREDAEFFLCNGITVGSWRRAYGSDPEKADAWRRLCSINIKATPASP
jgi:hypothetical protein